ncbi:MAG: hypothetical protein WAV25_03045 [Minisyncoccia bacterium]
MLITNPFEEIKSVWIQPPSNNGDQNSDKYKVLMYKCDGTGPVIPGTGHIGAVILDTEGEAAAFLAAILICNPGVSWVDEKCYRDLRLTRLEEYIRNFQPGNMKIEVITGIGDQDVMKVARELAQRTQKKQ